MNKITMRVWDDFHLHPRDGAMLNNMAPLSAQGYGRGTIMPNLDDPILIGEQAVEYRKRITLATGRFFDPLMTIQITPQTTPKIIRDAKRAGVIAGKIYPLGMTTNSQNGVLEYKSKRMRDVYKTMQETGMLLLLHGEDPKAEYCIEREKSFHTILVHIASRYPRLRIVLEHITNAESIEVVHEFENVAATITVHHLFLSLNDVIGGRLKPHHFCKPVAKAPSDTRALVKAAMSGHPRIFHGTDSAPWIRERKECADGCAGVFTAPVAPSLLIELFESRGKLDRLENFTSKFGAEFYGIERNRREITYRRKDWEVPAEYSGVVPFRAGEILKWQSA